VNSRAVGAHLDQEIKEEIGKEKDLGPRIQQRVHQNYRWTSRDIAG
jgi:hypothetical protein